MQKQKITYLALQSSYDHIEVALFEDLQKTRFTRLSKFTASSELIPLIKTTLEQQNLEINDLDFICASIGPAPFTTLRTTIVTLNGISFVTKLPLVGVNGLQAFTKEALSESENLVIILNAFNKGVYFGIRKAGQVTYGYKPIDLFLNQLKTTFDSQIVTMIGQGLFCYLTELQTLPANFILNLDYQQFPDIDLIAQKGLKLYLKEQTSHTLTPLYLKQAEPLK